MRYFDGMSSGLVGVLEITIDRLQKINVGGECEKEKMVLL